MDVAALFAAGAASVSAWAHGVVGQRWFVAQLRHVELRPTKPWGDADVTRRVFALAWHVVTAFFLLSAVTLYLAAFHVMESRQLLRFISVTYAASVGIGLVYLGGRPETLRRSFGVVVLTCLVTVSVLGWLP